MRDNIEDFDTLYVLVASDVEVFLIDIYNTSTQEPITVENCYIIDS